MKISYERSLLAYNASEAAYVRALANASGFKRLIPESNSADLNSLNLKSLTASQKHGLCQILQAKANLHLYWGSEDAAFVDLNRAELLCDGDENAFLANRRLALAASLTDRPARIESKSSRAARVMAIPEVYKSTAVA